MKRIVYSDDEIKRIMTAVALLRAQLDRLAEAPILRDGTGMYTSVSTGSVCVSVGLFDVIDGEICCTVFGTLKEEVIALLEEAGLLIAPDCK